MNQADQRSGDSWSDTKFDVIGEQPSPEQPMGNPPFPGDRDTKGAKWPVHLTTAYNDSLIQTYCFARSGAAVVREIVKNNEADLVEEVEKDFLPGYVDFDFGQSEWKSASSLFIFFIGINDNHIAEKWDNIQEVHEQQMQSYSFLIDMVSSIPAWVTLKELTDYLAALRRGRTQLSANERSANRARPRGRS